MFKHELKRNLKGILIWTIILAVVYGGVVLLYPSIIGDAGDEFQTLLDTMPQEMLKVFNMDQVYIFKSSGWILSEGYTLLLLVGSICFGILGSNILLSEETNKTIFFLATKPISKSKILNNKYIVGSILVLLFNIVVYGFIEIGLVIINDKITKELLLMFVLNTLMTFMIFNIGLLVSTFVRKNGVSLSITMGIIFISYVIFIISGISENVEFLKYASLFHYVDNKTIINNCSIDFINIIVPIVVSGICYFGALKKYIGKELF